MRRVSLFIATTVTATSILQGGIAYADESTSRPDSRSSAVMQLADVTRALDAEGALPPMRASDSAMQTELPDRGTEPATADTGAGSLTLEVPAKGVDLAEGDSATAVLEGAATRQTRRRGSTSR